MFYLLGIIYMSFWILFLVFLAIAAYKLKQSLDEAKFEIERKKAQAENYLKKLANAKVLGVLPIVPVAGYFARKIFKGIAKKI